MRRRIFAISFSFFLLAINGMMALEKPQQVYVQASFWDAVEERMHLYCIGISSISAGLLASRVYYPATLYFVGLGTMIILQSLQGGFEITYVSSDEINNSVASYFVKTDNLYRSMVNHQYNDIAIFNLTDLTYIRYGEKRVIDMLNYSEWNENIENYVCYKFDNDTKNIYFLFLSELFNWLGDVALTLNNITNADIGNGKDIYIFNGADRDDFKDVKMMVKIGNVTVNEKWNDYLYVSNSTILKQYSTRELLDMPIQVKLYKDNETYSEWNDYLFKDATFHYPNYIYKHYDVKIGIDNGTKECIFNAGQYNWKVNLDSIKALKNVYEQIRNEIILHAHVYWQDLKNHGWNDASDIPSNYVPVYPDVVLYDLIYLLNVTDYNIALTFFYVLVYNMIYWINYYIENNITGVIDWHEVDVSNISGISFDVTIKNATSDNGNGNIIVNGYVYLLPYHNATFQSGKTYAFTMNESKPAWADSLFKDNRLGVYDIENEKWYYLTTNENEYYNITIKQIYDNGNATDSVTLNVEKALDFVETHWNWNYTPIPIPHLYEKFISKWGFWLFVIMFFAGIILAMSRNTVLKIIGVLLIFGSFVVLWFYLTPNFPKFFTIWGWDA